MVNDRNVFKANLMDSRAEWTEHGIHPVCCICGKPIYNDGPDLHEVIISRGEAQGNKELQKIVTSSKFNCVLVHHSEHITEGDTKENDTKGILQLLEIEGLHPIIQWLRSLRAHVKGGLVDDKIRRVQLVHEGQVGNDDIQPGYDHGDG